ncbi:hypothetical protein [Pseudochrobactrum asaccharolyticum]|uniref:hypothetical protein n=1 Tax=Pseudochrobactrum asaccharolyticum TaxID=354351 RepID=UPI004043746E
MKIPMPDLDDEFDEFGDRIVRPIIDREEVSADGRRTQYLKNMGEYSAYTKQVSRNRDARMLENGEIDELGLRKKNDAFFGYDFSKVRIVAIGDKKYEDID